MKRKLFNLFLALAVSVGSVCAEVTIDEVTIDGIVYRLNGSTAEVAAKSTSLPSYYGYSGSIVIPSKVDYKNKSYSVTSIGWRAFYGCCVTSVTIGKNVRSIRSEAFDGCNCLTSVVWNAKWCRGYNMNDEEISIVFGKQVTSFTFGEEVEAIPQGFCSGMTKLTSITIPNSVTSIGKHAFSDCSSLTSVTIGNSVTSIGDGAFSNCTGLTSIIVESGNSTYDSRNNCNAIIETATNTLIAGCQATTIPNSVTSIGNGAFSNCTGLTSITIPNSVTSIGKSAFFRCTGLTSITIPTSVTSIGQYAFSSCTGLTSITIPNSVTSIGDWAFAECSGLTSVTIPESVTSIGSNAFYKCEGLTDIYVSCRNINSVTQMLENDVRIKSTLPAVITTNATNGTVSLMQDNCDVLLTAVPNDGYHFTQWSDGITDNPRTIILTQDTTFTAEFATDKSGTCGKDNALTWSYEEQSKTLTITGNGELTENYTFGLDAPTQMKTLIIGDGVTAIGDRTFYETKTLNHLFIGANVASIGDYTFAECKNFDDITCYATTVPTVNATTFENVGNKKFIYLYVPKDRERAYQRDEFWGEFDVQVKSAETTTLDDGVIVVPTDNTADISWPAVDDADTYEIEITKDGEVFCVLRFNANGQLTGIAFAPGHGKANQTEQAQTEGFKFTVTGLNKDTQYGYTVISKDSGGQVVDTKSGTFTTAGGIVTDVEQVIIPDGNSIQLPTATKVFRNGRIFILRGDKTYTLQGQEVK